VLSKGLLQTAAAVVPTRQQPPTVALPPVVSVPDRTEPAAPAGRCPKTSDNAAGPAAPSPACYRPSRQPGSRFACPVCQRPLGISSKTLQCPAASSPLAAPQAPRPTSPQATKNRLDMFRQLVYNPACRPACSARLQSTRSQIDWPAVDTVLSGRRPIGLESAKMRTSATSGRSLDG